MKNLNRQLSTQLNAIESSAVRDLAILTKQLVDFNGRVTEVEQKHINDMVKTRTNTLFNVKIINMFPLSFN
jgi:hypothetical protein